MRILLVLGLSLLFFLPQPTQAAGIVNGFGGRVIMLIPCTCSLGMAVYVAMPTPPYFGMFLWQLPFTRPYLWYFPYPTTPITGNYVFGGACFTGVPPYCAVLPVIGTITQVGNGLK